MRYIISESSFGRKIVKSLDEQGNKTEVQLHEGTLDVRDVADNALDSSL